jgi:glutamate/aspartate transport system substrate-binding protein
MVARVVAALWVAFLAGGVAASPAEEQALQRIKSAGAIVIGYREAGVPFSYLDAEKKPAGFAIDLCSIVAEKVKEALGLAEIRIEAKPITATDRAAVLKMGEADLDCSAAPVSAELARDVAFSRAIYFSQLSWLVPAQLRVELEGYWRRRYEVKTTSSADDLKGQTVALTRGSAASPVVLTASVDRYLGLSIVYGKDAAEAFKLVEAGKAQAFMDDDAVLLGLKAGAKNPDAYALLDGGSAGAAYAILLRKDDPAFKTLVDDAIGGAMKSGEFEKLYAKWFESPIPPSNLNLAHPMPAALKQLVKDAGCGASN